jgi:hypothetical protein
MEHQEFLIQLRNAFKSVPYPGDDHIVHCSYDKEWGGSIDGPCVECSEVVQYFRGKPQLGHDPKDLSWVAFGLQAFTPQAFCYWLPSFIEAAILHPQDAWGAVESIEFRFQSNESEAWQSAHIGSLNTVQLDFMARFFERQRDCKEISEKENFTFQNTLQKFQLEKKP